MFTPSVFEAPAHFVGADFSPFLPSIRASASRRENHAPHSNLVNLTHQV